MKKGISFRNHQSFSIKTTLVVFTLILFNAIFVSNTALAQTDLPQHFTLDGRLFEPGSNTTPLLDNNTILTIQVLNPDRDCVLYEEEQPVNTLGTNGYFSIRVGSNIGNTKRSGRDEGNSMNTVFYNTTAVINGRTQSNSNCTYDPASGDERFFRFFIKPSSASVAVQLSDDMPVNSVPQAIVAQTLQGYSPANFFRTSATSTQIKLDNLLTTEYSNITGLLDGSNPTYVRNDPAGTVFQSRSSDPSSPTTGQVWFNASDNKFKYYDGTTVHDVTNGSGSAVSITAGEGLDGGTITGTGTIDISDSGVTTDKLADGSVSTAKLIDTSVTEVKLADGAVTSVKLADDAVTTAKVVNEGITTIKLADSAVTTVKINDGAVTNAKLATGIDAAKITLNTLPASVVPTGTDDTKLPLTGGTLTGKLTLGDETDYAGFDLINTGHITMNGQKTITIGRYNDTQQTSLIGTLSPVNAGALWFNTTTGKLMYWSGTQEYELSESTSAGGDITAVNTNTGSGLSGGDTSGPVTLSINVDGTTIEIATNTLRVADGGIGTAKLADDAVTTAKVVNEGITSAKLQDGAVTSIKINDGAVTTNKLADTSVTEVKLANSAVTTAKLNDGAVTSVKLADVSVGTTKLADSAVTTQKLNDGAVTTIKLADGSVTTVKLADDAVSTVKVQDSAITSDKIANNAIIAAKLANDAVTSGKILDATIIDADIAATAAIAWGKIDKTGASAADLGAIPDSRLINTNTGSALSGGGDLSADRSLAVNVDGSTINVNGSNALQVMDGGIGTLKIADDAVTTAKVVNEGITTAKIADSAVTTLKINDGAVTTNKITDGAVTTNKLADGSVSTIKLADTSVTEMKLANSAVTTAKINDGAVTNVKLADGSVGTTKIADSAVTTLKLNDGSVTTTKLADGSVTTVKLANDAVTGAKILDGTITSADVDHINISKIASAPTEYFSYMPGGSACSDGNVLKWDNTNEHWVCDTDVSGISDHGLLSGLTDDDHTQYVMLAGRTGGQNLRGGTAANNNLTLESTSDAMKGYVLIQPNGGNVGIGTTAPNGNLHVYAPTGPSLLTVGSGNGDRAIIFLDGNANGDGVGGDYAWIEHDGTDGNLEFGNAHSTPHMVIAPVTGRVGIGTITPSEKLHVDGKVRASEFCIAGDCIAAWPSGGSGQWNNGTSSSINYGAGNVAIGTTTASQLLTVGSSGQFRVTSSGAVTSGSIASSSSITSNSGTAGYAYVQLSGNAGDGGGKVRFASGQSSYVYDAAISRTGAKQLTIDDNSGGDITLSIKGNVGIGTANPSQKLDVYGIVKATGFEGPITALSSTLGTGTSLLPSMTFVGDTDTGFWNSGSNQVGVAIGGSGTIFNFDSAGMVSTTTGGALTKSGNGSASAPTFSFSGDSDTGWYRPLDDTLAASTGGAEHMRITATGNVGIGTTSPSSRLDVDGYIRSSRAADNSLARSIYFGMGSDTENLGNSYSAGDSWFFLDGGANSGSNTLIFAGNQNRALNVRLHDGSLSVAGNVGVGTTNPVGKLHVATSTAGQASIFERTDDDNTVSQALRLHRTRSSATAPSTGFGTALGFNLEGFTNNTKPLAAQIGAIWENNQTNDTTDRNAAMTFSTISENTIDEKMRISSAGNVGIGTTNPSGALNIVRDSINTIYQDSYTTGNSNYLVMRRGRGTSASPVQPNASDLLGSVSFRNYGNSFGGSSIYGYTTELHSASGYGSDLRFGTTADGTTAEIERVRILSNGNVSIGTTNPNPELYVSDHKGLDIENANGTAIVSLNSFRDAANHSKVWGYAARGSRSAPLALSSADRVLEINATGFNGTGYNNMGSIEFFADGVQAVGSAPGGLRFNTTNPSATTYSEKMRITSGGNVGIGTTTPLVQLHVAGGSSSGGADQTAVQIGEAGTGTGPLYLIHNSPIVSGNAYYNAGWRYGGGIGKASAIDFGNGINFFTSNDAADSAHSVVDNMTSKMKINSNGNVGIATTAPNTTLTVYNPSESATLTHFTQSLTRSGINIVTDYTNGAYTPGIFWSTQDMQPTLPKAGIWLLEDGSGTRMYLGTSNSYVNGITNQGLTVAHTGNIGIHNTNPTFALDVTGAVRATGSVASWSDVRVKKDIVPLKNSLEKILSLNGVSYQWRTDEFPEQQFRKGQDIGVIAQEVEKQFPEVVESDNEGFKSVAYQKLIAPVIESIKTLYYRLTDVEKQQDSQERQLASIKKEVDHKMSRLEQQNEQLKKENQELKSRLEKIENLLKTK